MTSNNDGKWVWVTFRGPGKENWQSNEPITEEMKRIIISAWRVYDDSDARFDAISHEESVIARYSAEIVKQLKGHVSRLQKEIEDIRSRCDRVIEEDRHVVPEELRDLYVVPVPNSTDGEIVFFSSLSLDQCDQANKNIEKAYALGRKRAALEVRNGKGA